MNIAPYTPEPPTPQQARKLLPAITELRLRYLRSGYTPLPCVGKVPALQNWPNAKIDAAQVRTWPMLFPGALNIGIRTRYNPAVDIDVYDADLVRAIEDALLKYVPEDKLILRRVGVAPKRLIPFCCLTPFWKCQVVFTSPDGTSHRVEVLANGQQYIAEGWHPGSGEPYAWLGDKLSDVLPTRLPQLDQATAHKFLADVRELVTARGCVVIDESAKTEEINTNLYRSEPLRATVCNGNAAATVRNSTVSSAYARAALERECEAVASAAEGGRNNSLNRASFNLFQLVAGGELEEGEVASRLTDAAAACGLIADDGAKSVENTIASGAKAGLREPRRAPDHDDEVLYRTAVDVQKSSAENSAKDNEAPSAPSASPLNGTRRVELLHASTFEQRPIDWIWKPRLARGKMALFAGDPGVGKSSLVIDIVARASTAHAWPDNAGFATAGSCIILSAEDAANDTLCPRLTVAGADMERVYIMKMAGKPGAKLSFSLATDLPLLAAAVERLGDVILLVIDPISAYLGDKIDTHQTAAVRGVLEPLDAFAAHYRCGILGITHPPKAAQQKAINAFTGSLAFVAAARTAFIAIEEQETDRRLLLPVKSNIGPTAAGLAYRLEPTTTPAGIEAIRVQWDADPVDITANEAIAAAAEAARGSGQQREAEEFLEAYLEAGPMPADKVYAAAAANGISERTLERAKRRTKVKSEKDSYSGGWVWRLPQ